MSKGFRDIASQILDPAGGTIRYIQNGKSEPNNLKEFVDPLQPYRNEKNAPPDNPNADTLAAISKALFDESDPLRKQLIGQSQSFLSGGMDVRNTPMFASSKNTIDSAFTNAKNNIISSTPSGGALVDALTKLEGNRALDLSTAAGSMSKDQMGQALALATGQTPTAISGLSGAANIQAQQLMAQQQASNQQKQGLGQGIGTIAAMMFK